MTYDDANLRLYVNGGLVSTAARTGDMLAGTGVLRIGGNGVWAGEFFNGRIDEVRVYNRALSAAEITTDMATPLGGDGTPPGDVTPPTVSLTAPANGTTVTGTVAVSASASDAGGIAGVQFRVDGAAVGSEDTLRRTASTGTPTGVTAGSHTLTAVARDAAGNVATSAAVTVTVANAGADPAVVGQWTAPLEWPLVPVHMMLMRNGQRDDVRRLRRRAELATAMWDPATNTFIAVPYARNLFCSLHVALADGRRRSSAGTSTRTRAWPTSTIFDPGTRTWRRRPDMARGRWYPTATMLADGRVLVVSGDDVTLQRPGQPVPLINASNTLPEIYDPSTDAWTPTAVGVALDAPLPVHVPAAERQGARRRARPDDAHPRPLDRHLVGGRHEPHRRPQRGDVPAGHDPQVGHLGRPGLPEPRRRRARGGAST